MKNSDWLIFERKVRFGDCDSAGVIHFYNLFRYSHEAWEESLDIYGIPFDKIFPSSELTQNIIMPIVNSESKFFFPIRLGDFLKIKLMPTKINNNLFKVKTDFFIKNIKVAETIILHCVIEYNSRKKAELPKELDLWIEASNLNNFITEC
tara:strand:+ start:34124 stop:34573 length:450 start_codon:yes stop_codon:yes gene_type:complete